MKINLRKLFLMWIHPYKRSHKSRVYEEIAEICGCTPDRAYRIAHGARHSVQEANTIVPELIRRGIIQ